MMRNAAGCAAVFLVLAVTLCGCGKFDRSKIKMPKFNFVTSENVHSVAYAGADNVWISGNYGTLCFSSDAGRTWEKQDSGIRDLLLGSITFAGRRSGWASGVKGTILHTTDGGTTWQPQASGTEHDLLDLFCLDEHTCWVVGEFGTILHTGDGGASWAPQIEEQDTIYNDVFFADRRNGWVVGEFGTILHTGDGGASWQPQECSDIVPEVSATEWERPLPALYGLFFRDALQGWIVGMDGVILRTEDGGKKWAKLPSPTDKPLYSIMVKGNRGWIVGNKGSYLTSSDGGLTWSEKSGDIKTKFWLREVAFGNENNGVIVGAMGTIVRTQDGGGTWDIVSGFRYDTEEFGLADF